MSSGGSKNNRKNRGAAAKLKVLNGKEVKPVKLMLNGASFIAGSIGPGQLVMNKANQPIPYNQIVSDDEVKTSN
jgi:hypothetical protein